MHQLTDGALLAGYLRQYRIAQCFSTSNLLFRLYEYRQGEMLNAAHPPKQYLKFVVHGQWLIYAVHPDGGRAVISRHKVTRATPCALLGDLEFAGCSDHLHWQEALTTVRTVELPLAPLRAVLLQDAVFLRFVMGSLAAKLAASARLGADFATLEEKLLYHLRCEHPDGILTGVEAAAQQLHYSRRQLQRTLKTLTERGLLVRLGKGRYTLTPAGRRAGEALSPPLF